MIEKEEFDQLRRLIVLTRDHLDQVIEYLDAHPPKDQLITKDVVENHQTFEEMAVLSLNQTRALGENPACDNCGSITMRFDTYYRCYNCGNSFVRS